ncbi:hypothetical protein BGZ95_007146 [Linnemannia exigua]|uniref:RlpA-like protein double-psi beta-barrel domain-containing protein n=1 Tax=Linnemannia exigua TaxID=604196 RepID=A0AAD4H0E1_9FUNG|nr:hypothetical protein BGZ95_007146 [Linnemannia exigua]
MTVISKFVLLATVALAVAAAPIRAPTPVRHSTAVSLDIANFAKASSFSSKAVVARRADDNDESEDSSSSNDDDSSSDDKASRGKSNGDKSNGNKSNGDSTPTPTTSDDDSTPSPTSSPSTDDKVSSSASGNFSGRGTWFTDTTGSCDVSFDTNDMIVAMNEAQMGGTSQCGKSVKISYGGKTATAKVVDTCPSQYCTSGSLDLSQAVFKKLAPLDVGVIDIKWSFA